MAVVYRHIRLDTNQPFYIGIGKTERRANSLKNRNKYWNNIVSKTDYEVEILFDDLTWEQACKKEIEFIKLYGRHDSGNGCLVNMTDGGDGKLGSYHNEETKKRIAEFQRGNKWNLNRKAKEETKLKMSISHIGNKSNTGKKLSLEHRKNISEGLKGNNNLLGNQIWLGKNHTEETKQKMKLSWIERKKTFVNPMLGKNHTEETKEKLRQAWIKRKQKLG